MQSSKNSSTYESEWPLLPLSEIRRLLTKYRDKKSIIYKKAEKSNKICLWDIEVLAKIDRVTFHEIIKGQKVVHPKRTFGEKRQRRLSRILVLLEAGRITKTQHGVYTIHDEPVKQPDNKRMSVKIGAGGLTLGVAKSYEPPKGLPNFLSVFGR